MVHEPLGDLLAGYRQEINDEVARWIDQDHPRGFYDMMRYQLELIDADPESSLARRHAGACSLLCVLTCEAVGGSGGKAIKAAAAIELLAGWFQVHRDTEDQTPTNLGRPALWTRWSYPQAINTGDGMFPLASRAMLAAVDDPEVALTLARELTDTSLNYMEGRYHQLTFRDQVSVPAEARLAAIELTAGTLMGYSAWVGATIGGASDEVGHEMRRFGSGLGAACRLGGHCAGTSIWPIVDTITQYLDRGIAALQCAAIPPASRQRLASFARECVPSSSPWRES